MGRPTTTALHSSFGWLAGYLPEDPDALIDWLLALQVKAKAAQKDKLGYQHEAVQTLADLIKANGIVRMYLSQAIEEAQAGGATNIQDIADMLAQLDVICTTAPEYNVDKNKRVLFPMSALFVHVMATSAGKALFRDGAFNEGLRAVLKTWAQYLDSTDSRWVLSRDEKTGWLGAAAVAEYQLQLFEIDWTKEYGGFDCYNDFFHREIYSQFRPTAGIGDPSIVASANDGTVYRVATNVQAFDVFWIKEKNYSLSNMLNGPDSVTLEKYVGGTVVQVFLSGADYHRWHAPIDGVVNYQCVEGLLFSENGDSVYDPDAGVTSQVYGAAVNNRGLAAITASDPRLGTVYVMPIGITEISSLTLTATLGQTVKKGDELGYFNYGGSTLCLVFEKGVNLDFGSLKQGDTIKWQNIENELSTPSSIVIPAAAEADSKNIEIRLDGGTPGV